MGHQENGTCTNAQHRQVPCSCCSGAAAMKKKAAVLFFIGALLEILLLRSAMTTTRHLPPAIIFAKYQHAVAPSDEPSPEQQCHDLVTYWKEIPRDLTYRNPAYSDLSDKNDTKYLTFDALENGSLDDDRRMLETALVVAHALGRTLVLPSLLSERNYWDLYDLEGMNNRYAGINILPMDETLSAYFKNSSLSRSWGQWDTEEWDSVVLFSSPSSRSSVGMSEFEKFAKSLIEHDNGRTPELFAGKPTPVDASSQRRFEEVISSRHRPGCCGKAWKNGWSKLCSIDSALLDAKFVRLPVNGCTKHVGRWYSNLFFEDWRQDLYYKRLVRDGLRPKGEVACAAGRIVQALKERTMSRGDKVGEFDALRIDLSEDKHVAVRLSLLDVSRSWFPPNGTVYVSGIERNSILIQALAERYDVRLLSDYQFLLDGIRSNQYDLVDRLVSSLAETFIGPLDSAFDGYVNRLRGYRSAKSDETRYNGALSRASSGAPRHYSFQSGPHGDWVRPEADVYDIYRAVKSPPGNEEFPTAWRHIDRGTDELGSVKVSGIDVSFSGSKKKGKEYGTYYTPEMCDQGGFDKPRNVNIPHDMLYVTGRFGYIPGAFQHTLERHIGCVLKSGVFRRDQIRAYDTLPSYAIKDPKFERHLRFLDNMPCEDSARGAGYWFWKAVLIQRHLAEVSHGGYLFFTDPDRLDFLQSVDTIVWTMEERGHELAAEHMDPCYCCKCFDDGTRDFLTPEGEWSKGDLYEYFGVRANLTASGDVDPVAQYTGNFLAMKKTPKAIEFVNDLVEAVSHYHLISDEPSKVRNLKHFQENRHDQSVLSMTLRYKHRDGSEKKKLEVPYLKDWTLYTFKL